MGKSQSRPRLDIYLLSEERTYPDDSLRKGYTVNVSKGAFQDNKKFHEITHRIQYHDRNPKKFDIYVYNTKGQRSDYSFNFSYYSLRGDYDVPAEIKAYYPFFSDQMPLIIHLKMKDRNHYTFRSDDLRGKWFKPYFLYKHDLKTRDLNDQLETEFDKLLKGNTITFTAGTANEGAMAHGYNIDSDNYHKAIYIPRKSRSNLGSECLSKIDGSYKPVCEGPLLDTDQNKIDKYFLKLVDGNTYEGIMLYFDTKDTAGPGEPPPKPTQKDKLLLLELVGFGGSKTYIKRMDVDGNWWAQVDTDYGGEKELLGQLPTIKSEAERNDVNVVILDNKEKYKGVQSVTPDTQERNQAYVKYTYTFETHKRPVTINAIQEVNPVQFDDLGDPEFKTKKVDVYFLKAEDGQSGRADTYGRKEDDKPFLIVFDPDKTGNEKIYHFGKNYGLQGWQEFRKNKRDNDITKLNQRLAEIEHECTDLGSMELVKDGAYTILTRDDPEDKEEEEEDPSAGAEEDEENEVPSGSRSPRPEETPVHDPGNNPDITIIIVGTGAGLVLVGTVSSGGYLWTRLGTRKIRDMTTLF